MASAMSFEHMKTTMVNPVIFAASLMTAFIQFMFVAIALCIWLFMFDGLEWCEKNLFGDGSDDAPTRNLDDEVARKVAATIRNLRRPDDSEFPEHQDADAKKGV